MTVESTMALLMPALAAYLVLRRFGRRSPAPFSRALAAALAPGFGIGFASCVYFSLLLLIPNHRAVLRLDAGLWLLFTIGLLADKVRQTRASEPRAMVEGCDAGSRGPWRPALVVTAVGFLALLALATASFSVHWALNPHGEWDAWAVWNLRARSLFATTDWATRLSPAVGWSHPDYPLLLPLAVARLWAYSGQASTVVPAAVAMLFSASSIAVVVISVGQLRGWPAGLLGGMALLISRTYIFQSSSQCADEPVGFFILVAISFLAISRQETESRALLVVAGAAAGLAAWTKNEGVLLLLLVLMATSVRAPRSRALLCVTAGAVIPVLALAIFKARLAPSNYLVDQQAAAVAEKIVDKTRWMFVIGRLVYLVPAWGEVPGGALAGLGLAVALTAGPDRRSAGRAASALLLVTMMLMGYGLVYVITPLPLEWQIATSLDRLLTQLWPTVVWAAFQLSSSGPSAGTRSSATHVTTSSL
jgi:hypothetical protein